ncbi:hypothetical protein MHU86_9725 [Fragilaria crotonensis]|nr:hypothetical protein MHU86_9725 [Fragilaria crotonensis]
MAASLTGKRISTTTLDVSEPSEITTEGHTLQGPVSNVQATHKNNEYVSTGSISRDDGVESLQKPIGTVVHKDSFGSVLSDDIKAIKARARNGRTSSLQPGFVTVRDDDQETKENLRSFGAENTSQYGSSGSASIVRARKVRTLLQIPKAEIAGDKNDEETRGIVRSSTDTEHALNHQNLPSVSGASTSVDNSQAIKDRARYARSTVTQSLTGTVFVDKPQGSSDFETQEGHPSVSARERSSFSDGIQGMKDRAQTARTSLIGALAQPGFVAVQDAHVDALDNKDRNPKVVPSADNASGQNFRVPRNLRVSYPAPGSYISQIRFEKEAAMKGVGNDH